MSKKRLTLAECLEDISKQDELRVKLAHVAGELLGRNGDDLDTLREWFNAKRIPKGLNAVRAMVILEMLDYEVVTDEDIYPECRDVGECLTFGVICEDNLKDIFPCEDNNIRRLLLGRGGTVKAARQVIRESINPYLKERDRRKVEWSRKLGALVGRKERDNDKTHHDIPVELGPVEPLGEEALRAAITKEEAIGMMANMVRAMKPLARWLLTDDFTAEDRKRLRQMVGNAANNDVSILRGYMTQLCSEHQRREEL